MADDTWERHLIVSELAGNPAVVLDVGGVAGDLEAFLPDSRVTSLNVGEEKADVHFDGRKIPFDDDSFDVAVSLDVLEHLPPTDRAGHVAELRRVARGRVILCCPLGSPEHVVAERELAEWYQGLTGSGHRFLEEHLVTGLPTEEELRQIARSAGGFDLRFQGDFRTVNELFRKAALTRRRPSPRNVASYVRARLTARRQPAVEDRSNPHTNRAFLISR
jgi:ubiquinone/menaquinone biosynthesis C-methylase UbiE